MLIGIVDPSRPESTVDAFRAGVFDVLPWPIVPWDLSAVIANAQDLADLSAAAPPERVEVSPYGVFGTSPAIRKVIELLPRVSPSRCPIVLYGERGTGREMLARAIHGHGRRGDAPFVSIDCSSATPQEIEDELFGCVSLRRADGTEERRTLERVTTESKLYRASGGTLFLMNLPEMPARVQAKLHRVLRDREVDITRERRRIELDIRPIAAVEPGFEAVVEEGRLRRDLYERLSLIRIELPPLRQRREDMPFLVNHFLKEICRAGGMPLKTTHAFGRHAAGGAAVAGERARVARRARATRAAHAAWLDTARGRAVTGAHRRQRGRGGRRHVAAGRATALRARLHRRRRTPAPWPDGRSGSRARHPADEPLSQAAAAERRAPGAGAAG